MTSLARRYLTIFACAALALGCGIAGLAATGLVVADDLQPPAKDDAFGLTKVWQIHLELSAKELEKMQPVGGGFGFGFAPKGDPKKAPEKPPEKQADTHKGGGFGTEFPWASAALTAEGKTYKNLGIRYKGNSTYSSSANMLKRPMQIDFEHYGGNERWRGLKKLSLSNGVTDPARLRETLAFEVFRAAGVPASKTAYVEITLTVPGKYDKEYLGLYVLIEHVGNQFLKERFQSAKGLLLKPELSFGGGGGGFGKGPGGGGLEFLGEDWAAYEKRYQPKTEATKSQKKRFIDFTRLINNGSDEQFNKEIGAYLDVDEFLRYLAVNALLVNLDSFIGISHNYYMYLRPDNNKIVFIPWDLDLSFGVLALGGSPEQQLDLSINHPHVGQNKLIDRLLAMNGVKDQYQKILKDLTATSFSKEKLFKDLDALEQVTKAPLAREKQAADARKETAGGFGFGGGPGFGGQTPPLRTFVEKRTEAVTAQLAGKSKGYEPGGFGFAFGGKKGPGGFGMGNFLAKPLLTALDKNDDSKLSLEEWTAWAKAIAKEHDKDGKGIDDKALAAELGKLLPFPKFAGPGAPPGGGKGQPGG
ncbi:MAG TPA: CotH kinase family protein, partial [Gemmataceae bacterium]|nr:CotH kinase family protein [Gemmataceae bacterium]